MYWYKRTYTWGKKIVVKLSVKINFTLNKNEKKINIIKKIYPKFMT